MKRKLMDLSGLCVLAVVLLSFSNTFAEDVQSDLVMHARLIWTENPQSRAVVCWDTATEGKKHQVYFDTESRNAVVKDYSNHTVAASGPYAVANKEGTNDVPVEPDLYYHHAQLTDLQPGTTYYFVMASDGVISKEYHFKTAPAKDEALKIIFGGDSRTGIDARRKINGLIAMKAEADDSILALAHGGDYVGDGTKLRLWKSWMKDHELTITAGGRMLPLIPARGNHEAKGPLYDQVLGFPGGEGTNYYATWLSPEILFLTLNTEIEPDGAQKEFLDVSLAGAYSNRWRAAQYHRPLYPAVKAPAKAFEHWVPLFEKYNLALACEADGHCIKRTVPIRSGTNDITGVVYIGEGGLGVGQRKPDTERWYIQPPGMVSQGHHFQLLSFTKNDLTIEVVGIDGKVIDSHTIAVRELDVTGGSQAD